MGGGRRDPRPAPPAAGPRPRRLVCRAARRREPLRAAIRRLRLPALGAPRRMAGRRRRRQETVDFTPVGDGIDADLATRDFTFNAIAVHVGTGATHDPHEGRADLEAGVIRAVSESIFVDDPLRLLRAVRFEDELGIRNGRADRGASPCLGRARHGARGRARARGARAALGRRAIAVSTRSASSRPSADGSTSASTRSTTPTSGSSPSSGTTSAGCRSRTS